MTLNRTAPTSDGFSVADNARQCDFLGPHVYPVGDDVIRQHAAEPVSVKPQLAAGGQLRELAGGTPNGTIILPPFGVGVFRIEGAGPGH